MSAGKTIPHAAAAALLAGLYGCANVGTSEPASNEFRDCSQCPVMVSLPGGTYLMGTAEQDRLIDPRTGRPATNDSPQHEVAVPAFAFGKYEVTVAEFRAFVNATGYDTVGECMEFSKPGGFTISSDFDWENPGFEQADNAPVGCVSYFDAQAYAAWLSDITGENYRLPSEAEWEYAARAGSPGAYFWGDDEARACAYANVRSAGAFTISQRQADADQNGFPCDDGYEHTAPVGSFLPNGFGLYDMQGNNWEWVADCNHKNYVGAPVDGSAWNEDDCRFGVIRSGSYLNLVERSTTTVRAGRPRSGAATNMGFRVAKADSVVKQIAEERWKTGADSEADSRAAALFNANCAACHGDSDTYQGVYGRDPEALFRVVRDGGNNSMSMPAFGDMLTDEEIRLVVAYVIEQNGW